MSIETGCEHVLLEVTDGVAMIRLDRPKVNAINIAMLKGIRTAALWCADNTEVAAVVVTGSERAFAAGVDIKEMAAMNHAEMQDWAPQMQNCYVALAQLPKPVIAAVNGWALGGGCELSLAADLRFAGDNVTFGQPEIQLGIIPGAGGTQRLARLIGAAKAKDLIFTGRQVKADEALAIGLVDQVHPVAECVAKAVEYARQFVHGPAVALQAAKECIDRGLSTDLAAGLDLESRQFADLFATKDREIGMTSFMEKGPGKAAFRGC